jgi:hypothetical protein
MIKVKGSFATCCHKLRIQPVLKRLKEASVVTPIPLSFQLHASLGLKNMPEKIIVASGQKGTKCC